MDYKALTAGDFRKRTEEPVSAETPESTDFNDSAEESELSARDRLRDVAGAFKVSTPLKYSSAPRPLAAT